MRFKLRITIESQNVDITIMNRSQIAAELRSNRKCERAISYNFQQSSSNFVQLSLLQHLPPKTARVSKKHTQTAGEMVSGAYSPCWVPYHFLVVLITNHKK